jgi:hypothetical protein
MRRWQRSCSRGAHGGAFFALRGDLVNIKLSLIVASIGLFSASAASAQEARAVEVGIFGVGPAVDGEAFAQVRSIIARSVADNDVMKFIVTGVGIEGGYAACVELKDPAAAHGLLTKLRRVRTDPSTTSYEVTPAASCAQ